MKKIELKGYIEFNEAKYTFIYKDEILTLININSVPGLFHENKYIEYLEGYTVDGFEVAFYVFGNTDYWCGVYICCPQIILLSIDKNKKLSDKYDTLYLSGGIINRFYPNKKILKRDCSAILFNYNKIEDTVCEEEASYLNSKLELSVSYPGWKDDGNITFDNINSILRLKYDNKKNYKEIIKDILTVNKLMYFCSNRRSSKYEKVYIESIDEETKKYTKSIQLFIRNKDEKNKVKNMIKYEEIKGKLDILLIALEESKYSTYIIPENDKEYIYTNPSDFVSKISAYQSIYNYVVGQDIQKLGKSLKLEEIKIEIIDYLGKLDEKYKCVDSKKRQYIKRFNAIIQGSNLKLEKQIENILKENEYLFDTLHYSIRDKVREIPIDEFIEKGIETRDKITHNDIVKLDEYDIALYVIISKLIYVLILYKIGLEYENIKSIIKYLSLANVI